MGVTIQLRRDITSNWQTVNPVLNEGEFGIEYTSDKSQILGIKIGNGSDTWNNLDYFLTSMSVGGSVDKRIETLEVTSNIPHGTNITLPNGMTYHNNNKSLEVYVNHLRMINGKDFTEIDDSTISFTDIDLQTNDVVLFVAFKTVNDLNEKTVLADNDEFLISDSEDNYVNKKTTLETIEKRFEDVFMVKEGGITVNVSTSQELIDAINEYNRKKIKGLVTIQLADGTYTIDNTIHITGTGDEAGYIYIKGNEADRTATTIHINVPNENWGFWVSHYGKLKMSDILITGNLNTSDNTGNYGIACQYYSYLNISHNMEFHNFKTAVQASVGYIQADNSTYRECGYSIRSCGRSTVSAYNIDISVTENDSFHTMGIQACNTSNVYVSGNISNTHYGLYVTGNSYSYVHDLSVYNTKSCGITIDGASTMNIGISTTGNNYMTEIDGNGRCDKGIYATNNSFLNASSLSTQVKNCNISFCSNYNSTMILSYSKSLNASRFSYECENSGNIIANRAYSQLPTNTGEHFHLGHNTYINANNSELHGGNVVAGCYQSSVLHIENATSADVKSIGLYNMANVIAYGTDFTANISANTVTISGVFYK